MKTNRIIADIDKTKTKIGELQAKLRELERQKTEMENTEIIELVRAIDAAPGEVATMLRALMESQRQQAMASLAPQIEDEEDIESVPQDEDNGRFDDDDEQEDADDEA